MARKTDAERLQELEEKIEQIKEKKQQVASRIQQKERKERTRRLIQVGAIFEKYFEFEGQEVAEKIAMTFQRNVLKNKEKVLGMSLDQIREANKKVEDKQSEIVES